MKYSKFIVFFSLPICVFGGCVDKKAPDARPLEKTVSETMVDSTIYGECGEGTAMHTLQLITDMGDTLEFTLLDDNDMPSDVQGGLMTGDKMAVVAKDINGMRVATKVINVTTLLGRWASIDKNFVIEEGGTVKSNLKAEKDSWVSWKIFNGRLLLNKDTFIVNTLGADSLYLENDKGIYVYKRQK